MHLKTLINDSLYNLQESDAHWRAVLEETDNADILAFALIRLNCNEQERTKLQKELEELQ